MEYRKIVPPDKLEFETMTKKQASEFFDWYIKDKEYGLCFLEKYLQKENEKIKLDYSPESLISIWEWYEDKIKVVNKTLDELGKEMSNYPTWMHAEIKETKVSLNTLIFAWDVAIYFAETIIKNSQGKIYWGYFSKPKNRMSVNQPTLLGFKSGMDLNPRQIVMTCTRKSCLEFDNMRLVNAYYTWQEYIE